MVVFSALCLPVVAESLWWFIENQLDVALSVSHGYHAGAWDSSPFLLAAYAYPDQEVSASSCSSGSAAVNERSDGLACSSALSSLHVVRLVVLRASVVDCGSCIDGHVHKVVLFLIWV